MSNIRIGFSGWRYVPWRGDFYPEKLTHKNELKFASRSVNGIEINGSFYSLQSPGVYARWSICGCMVTRRCKGHSPFGVAILRRLLASLRRQA